VGVLPTPGVAYLTGALQADLGVMLSASHNPMPDNGIKFFARGGHKLADEIEDAIEQRAGEDWARPVGAAVGRIGHDEEAVERYLEHLLATMANGLAGLKVVVDCAQGAAFRISPEVMRRAGASVVAIGAEPDGLNINDGYGSTHLQRLQAAVIEHGADAGIAHDGDADRCLAVDAAGEVVDGDQILAVLALAMRDVGALSADTVVATVMSNLGFRLAMEREGLAVVETAVGDRYVLEAMRAGGFILGGEQSGHVIMLQHSTTGDGLLTALQVLARMAATGRSLTELAAVMERLPQVLINVPDVDRKRVASCEPLQAAVAEAALELGTTGRVLLRPSGTEPLVRVMVEAPSHVHASDVAERLAKVVYTELALPG
jgi:phosphoglucosamine mutase